MSREDLNHPMCLKCARSLTASGLPKSEKQTLLCTNLDWSSNNVTVNPTKSLRGVLHELAMEREYMNPQIGNMELTGRTCFRETLEPIAGEPSNNLRKHSIWGEPTN